MYAQNSLYNPRITRPPSTTLFPYTTLFRSVVIRGRDSSLCPVCGRKAAIKQFGAASGIPELERWCASVVTRSEEHTSELQSHSDLVCRLLLEKKNIMIK